MDVYDETIVANKGDEPVEVMEMRAQLSAQKEYYEQVFRDGEKQIEKYKQDAERYRWLRSGEDSNIGVVSGLVAMDYGSSGVAYTYEDYLCGEYMDAAINAAMKGGA